MTAPRQILTGTTYLITRRCTQRLFLLRPSETINEIVLYCLAVAADRFPLEIHAYKFMGNHYHAVVTDPEGCLPEFMQYFNLLMARALNARWGHRENFWAPGSYSAVKLATGEDILEKLVYVFTNEVAAGLVASSSRWPGVGSTPGQLGVCLRGIKRPKTPFFSAQSTLPERVALKITPPPMGAELTLEALRATVAAAVQEKEQTLRATRKSEGKTYLGRTEILRQSPFTVPKTPEPRRTLNPRIAAIDTQVRKELLEELREFLEQYRQAWCRFCQGVRDVVFPAGTYLMRVRYAVACDPPP